MEAQKLIVSVNASFAQGEELFTLLKKYAQYSDDQFAYWDECAFTVSAMPETDALLIFNHPSEKIRIQTDPAKLIAFMMEPGIRRLHPWMFKGLDVYAKVFSPLPTADNVVPSHGYLGWYFKDNWDFLSRLSVPQKTSSISCIASDLKQLKGHRLRIQFIDQLRQKMPQIEFFGKGSRFLPDKLSGLLPYRYSVAIENSAVPDYFTEKINDCFLSYTVPLYYGCTNIGKYFPEKAFVSIDITKPHKAIKTIEDLLDNDDWSQRLAALEEARFLVLNKYQPLAGAAAVFRSIPTPGFKCEKVLAPLSQATSKPVIRFFKKLGGKKDTVQPR